MAPKIANQQIVAIFVQSAQKHRRSQENSKKYGGLSKKHRRNCQFIVYPPEKEEMSKKCR